MASGSWTAGDARTWWALGPRGYPTALLVLFWIAIRVVVVVEAPGGLCGRTGVCVPAPGAGWWATLSLASVVLVPLWPVAATLTAFAFALAEAWWRLATGEYNLSWSRPILDLAYAVACAAHMLYVQRALNRQRRFAFAHAAAAPEISGGAAIGAIPSRWIIAIAAGAGIGGAVVFWVFVLEAFISEYFDTNNVYWYALTGVWPILAGCSLVAGGVVGWRRERRRLRVVRSASDALTVDACMGLDRNVLLYPTGVDKPFAQFKAIPEFQAEGPETAVGDVLAGNLVGDLRAGGFTAFISNEAALMPLSELGRAAGDNPRNLRDAPAPDATAEALERYPRIPFLGRATTQYVLTPDKITRTHTPAGGRAAVDSIDLRDLREVRYVVREGGDTLLIAARSVNYEIPPSAHNKDFRLLLGERLHQHRLQHVVADDKTRIHLGLVGPERNPQPPSATPSQIDPHAMEVRDSTSSTKPQDEEPFKHRPDP